MSEERSNELTETEKDYLALEAEMKSWKCENTHKPFQKNIVTLLGVYSSGKSSFANNFFKVGIQIVAPTQQDTTFTIIETINEDEFARLVTERTGKEYKRYKMSEKILRTPREISSDPRRNSLYLALDTPSTLIRYQQFDDFSRVFREYNLISTLLINEHYLRGSVEEINMYKNTIMIDSPGFTSETNVGKLKGNLRVLKYFYQLSDLILFMSSADSLSNISSEITLLELSILYALEGETYFEQAMNDVLGKKDDSFRFGIIDFFGSIVNRFTRSNPGNLEFLKYDGTTCWNKVNFVITKIDVGKVCSCNKELRAEGQFFELGLTLGKTLKFLKAPVFDKCFAISLPQHRKSASNNNSNNNNSNAINLGEEYSMTGDLRRLIYTIGSLNCYNSFSIRLENSIQKMCSDLTIHINNTKWFIIPTTSYSTIDTIKARSVQRLNLRKG